MAGSFGTLRPMCDTKIMLVHGVSGAGKTALIQALLRLDRRFKYIAPYTTRPLRHGECDKIRVSADELARLTRDGKLLAVNQMYGSLYGTPRKPIEDALRQRETFPVLDWPMTRVSMMEGAFPGRLHRVYVEPPSLQALVHRLRADGRDASGKRLTAALTELRALRGGGFDGLIDHRVLSLDRMLSELAETVRCAYLAAIGLG